MKEPLVIIGASGFGREVANLVEDINKQEYRWDLLGLIDDKLEGITVEDYKIIGPISVLDSIRPKPKVVIAIADTKTRRTLANTLAGKGFSFATLVHPTVSYGRAISIGEGTIICKYSHLTTNISVGKHNIINEICGFGHDTVLHDFVSIMSHSIFGGNVEVGNGCYFGLNTVVINQIKIGEWSVIGAGATVVDDIPPYSLAVGVPARVIKKLDQFDV